jgi:hypothetical protein
MRRSGPPNGAAGCAGPTLPKGRPGAANPARRHSGSQCCSLPVAASPWLAVLARGATPGPPMVRQPMLLAAGGSFAVARSASPGGGPRTPRWPALGAGCCCGAANPDPGLPTGRLPETLIMAAWSALLAGPRITRSARAVTGVIASTSHRASRPSHQWPGSGRVSCSARGAAPGTPAGPGGAGSGHSRKSPR